MLRNHFDVNRYVDKKLEQIGGVGNFVGSMLSLLGRNASRVMIGLGVLLVFGIAVFIWSVIQGMKKKKY